MNGVRICSILTALFLVPLLGCGTTSKEPTTAPQRASFDPPRGMELVGRALPAFPHFEIVRSIGVTAPIEVTIDLGSSRLSSPVDLYIVTARSREEWDQTTDLIDVRASGPTRVAWSRDEASGKGRIIRTIGSASDLPCPRKERIGVAFDLVIDVDRDGQLGAKDWIDGYGDEPGFYVVRDTTEAGPLTVSRIEHDGGDFLKQRIFYPTVIAELGRVPLIVISHGWTHRPEYYDHLGRHLASYGYVVLAHSNDVGRGNARGTETASTTTIRNTDHLLEHADTIADGRLDGHLDRHKIVWIGHSTGGECVVRAHTRIRTGDMVPANFGLSDIALVSSICPVAFLSSEQVTPEDVPYHMFVGGADTDTSGAPVEGWVQSLAIFERATGPKQLIYVQNSGHEWFHAGDGRPMADGPDLVDRPDVHAVVKGYYLPLVELYTRGNLAARDFFTRNVANFRPLGIPDRVLITKEYHEARSADVFVVDDYQEEPHTDRSSSGGRVTFDVDHVVEVGMHDQDGSFEWTGAQPSNGMTRGKRGDDHPRCVVFDWSAGPARFYELEVAPAERDLSDDAFLSFRACQGTRHPATDRLDGPLTFTVTLRDTQGASQSIPLANYGAVTRPYRRTGFGSGHGWGNEFSTFRIRLSDFATGESELDLRSIEAIRFDFGRRYGSAYGRIGLDDVVIIKHDPAVLPPLAVRPVRLPTRICSAKPTVFEVRVATPNHQTTTTRIHYQSDADPDDERVLTLSRVGVSDTYRGEVTPDVNAGRLDFYFSATDPNIGTATSPRGAPDSRYTRTIEDLVIVHRESFDRDPGWKTSGQWEFGLPRGGGGGGDRGHPDPTSGATGASVYGVNLAGDYNSELGPFHLTTGRIDLGGRRADTLRFQRWLNCDARRWVRTWVSVSTDGEEWSTLWMNGSTNVEDSKWRACELDLRDATEGATHIWLRWSYELVVPDAWKMSGWNLDDVEVLGSSTR